MPDRNVAVDRVRSIALAIAWFVCAVILALGSAGIVTGVGAQAGTISRPELTWTTDDAVRPGLVGATADLEQLADDVEALGTQGRGALAAIVARDAPTLDGAVQAGTDLLLKISSETTALRQRLQNLPGIAGRTVTLAQRPGALTAEGQLALGPDTRRRYEMLLASLNATDGLADGWARLTAGSLAASRLTRLLAEHDTQTLAAAAFGRSAKWAAALQKLNDSDAVMTDCRAMRDQLANSVDVSTLDLWLNRNAAYDAALRKLYRAWQASNGKVTTAVRQALAEEKKALELLPPDTRGLVVIMGEIARGGINQAVITIEGARGTLRAALEALAALEASSAPGSSASPGAPSASPAAS